MFLGINHRDTTAAGTAAPLSSPVWRTCLREVSFVDHERSEVGEGTGATFLAGAEAYAFLLETICGLRSPMLGETQVLGQFRAFLASLDPADAAWLGGIGEQLITDARQIRERHLRGLGSRSYGSAVRRHLADAEAVALVGAGALAAELLPYVSEGRRVDQWTRAMIASAADQPVPASRTALIVAAPVGAAAIAAIAARYSAITQIIDLRDARERDPLPAGIPVTTLDDLFAAVAATSAAAEDRVADARRDIRRLAAAFERRQQFRPFGWDDLCA